MKFLKKKGKFTEVILVFGMSGQIPEETRERTQLQIVVGTQQVQQHRQHALLLQSHLAQHRSPLQDDKSRNSKMQSFSFFFFFVFKCAEEAAHPLVSSGHVLQRSSSRLADGGVDLALVQHAVVQPDYLRVPQPLHPLRHPSHLGEGGQILVLALSG